MSASRFFRALLRLLPLDFRTDYAKDIEQAYREQCREARREGRISEARVCWKNIRDIVAVACREHVSSLVRDIGHTLRFIRRQPGFALVTVLTLALGIGANTAIFSVVHAVLLKPLPYAAEDRLVHVRNRWTGQARAPLSDPEYLDYAERSRSLELAAMAASDVNLSMPSSCIFRRARRPGP